MSEERTTDRATGDCAVRPPGPVGKGSVSLPQSRSRTVRTGLGRSSLVVLDGVGPREVGRLSFVSGKRVS